MDRRFSYLRYLKYSNVINRLTYMKWDKFIEHSQWWSKEKLDDYQWKKVKQLLEHAYSNVTYYTELFQKIGATPNDIKTWNDYYHIPLLTKDIVRERAKDLIAKTHINNRRLQYYTTGGSTGQPLGFYKTADISIIESAFMNQQWKRVGYKESSSRVILRGEPVSNGKLFQKFRFTNDWLISSYHLSETYLSEYVTFLNRIKPEFFHVYPSSLYVFTKLLLDSKYTLDFSPKAILCGSEPIHDYQRDLFEKTFKTRVYSWLGSAEGTTLAGECEHSTLYHAWPQHSYLELINERDEVISELNLKGEIVGTTFNNYASPLIRYRSGDISSYSSFKCEDCMRVMPILNRIEGRVQDVVFLKDGTTFPIGPAIFGIHEEKWGLINGIQLLQERKGEITVKVLTAHDQNVILEFLTKTLDKRISHVISYKIEFVSELQRTKSGKHRLLIQQITQNNSLS